MDDFSGVVETAATIQTSDTRRSAGGTYTGSVWQRESDGEV